MTVTACAPVRSDVQRMEALERANAIRVFRADLKRKIRGGRVVPREVVLAPAGELESMKVFELLLAIPKVGRVKANKTLVGLHISPSKTLGGLSERQRRELAAALPAHARVLSPV